MKLNIDVSLDYWFNQKTDILLAVQAAPMADQTILSGTLNLWGKEPILTVQGGSEVGARHWTTLEMGRSIITYKAVVEVCRKASKISGLESSRLPTLAANIIPFIWPSRYCEADRFHSFVNSEFGNLKGGNLVQEIVEWVHEHISYISGCSDTTTTAVDTFVARQGVCRDFAHLTAALIRAADIPARLVSVYALGLPKQDFHAVVEVWLEGAWHIVDATDLAPIDTMVRIAAGRDATDIAFMTSFGWAQLNSQFVVVRQSIE
jgi:transglutaminase-like putative cysteine protease